MLSYCNWGELKRFKWWIFSFCPSDKCCESQKVEHVVINVAFYMESKIFTFQMDGVELPFRCVYSLVKLASDRNVIDYVIVKGGFFGSWQQPGPLKIYKGLSKLLWRRKLSLTKLQQAWKGLAPTSESVILAIGTYARNKWPEVFISS